MKPEDTPQNVRSRVKSFFCFMLNKFYVNWAIIQAKQNIAVYPERYMIVDLRNERSLGDQLEFDTQQELIFVEGFREATLNVQAIGENSVEALDNLRQILEQPTVVDEFFKANIAVVDVGEVQDLTDLIDNSRYLERASVDLTVSYDRFVIDRPGWFESVSIEANYDQSSSDTIDVGKEG